MHIRLQYGLNEMDLDVPAGSAVLPSQGGLPAVVANPAEAVSAALEAPLGFPALRRALTPDDHVAIVVDSELSQPVQLMVSIIEHIQTAQVPVDAITLVTSPTDRAQSWIDDLPDELLDVHLEAHAPQDRRQLSYVATMRNGRRLYLNRSVADADQAVVLSASSRIAGDGGATLLFPDLSDEATRREWQNPAAGRAEVHARRAEIEEAIWLLGAPFFVHVVEGLGDTVAAVVAGMSDTVERARELDEARWLIARREPVQTVVAAVSGSPGGQDFGTLARAATTAARLVQEGGRIVLVTDVHPELSEAFDMLRQADTPEQALRLVQKNQPAGHGAAMAWAAAARHARIFLLSGLAADTVEELHAAPIENVRQVGRLVNAERACLVLRDAHKVQLAP